MIVYADIVIDTGFRIITDFTRHRSHHVSFPFIVSMYLKIPSSNLMVVTLHC